LIQAYGGGRDQPLRRGQPRSTTLHGSVWVQAWYLPVIEFAGLGTTALIVVRRLGWPSRTSSPSAPSPSSC
jgi:hypothetical protein